MHIHGKHVNLNNVQVAAVKHLGWVILALLIILWGLVSLAQPGWAAPNEIDLRIEKLHAGDFVIGSTAIYQITVTNDGSDTLDGTVTVTDSFPAGLTPTLISGEGWTCTTPPAQTISCTYPIANLLAGQALPAISIVVSVSEQAAPSVVNTALLSFTGDSDVSNNVATDTATVVSADLAVTKTAAPTQAQVGGIVNFSLRLRNNGPSLASNVVLTDTLPTGLSLLSAIPTRGAYNSATGLWNVGSLGNTEVVTLTLSTIVNAGTQGLEIVNTTNGLDSDLYDYNTSNNTGTASVRILSTRLIGQVREAGTDTPVSAASVQVVDFNDHAYATTTSASGWYTFTDSITTPLSPGLAEVTASKTGYESASANVVIEQNEDNRQDLLLGTSDLQVSLTDGKTTVVPGEVFTYTITVSNTGSIPAAQVLITDILPTYLSYITDTLGIDASNPITGTYVWELGDDLDPDDLVSFRLRVRTAIALPSTSTSITNRVEVDTVTAESNTDNNTDLDTNTSTGTPNISITKSVSPTQVRTGQNATYTIRVTNTGTAPVTEATVTDNFSSYVDVVSSTTTKGTATTNTTARRVTVNIGTLGINESVTITAIVRVNSTATNNLYVSNTASVSYKFGGTTSTRTSTAVSFQVLATSTLPGTGGIELVALQDESPRSPSPASMAAWLAGLLLAVCALGLLVYAFRARRGHPEWSNWALRLGMLLAMVACVFGFFGWGIGRISTRPSEIPLQASEHSEDIEKQVSLVFTEDEPYYPSQQPGEPDKLPDFPVPTPDVQSSQGSEIQPDTSNIERIQIPAINLDTVVKYVPFDGLTWLIAGLQLEVAWMGDTSWPGLGGNTALAGHVTLWNGTDGPFRYLEKVMVGDQVAVHTEDFIYTYKVREQVVVDDTDLSILTQTSQPQLTLITCKDFDRNVGFYRNRLVIFADLVDTQPASLASRQ